MTDIVMTTTLRFDDDTTPPLDALLPPLVLLLLVLMLSDQPPPPLPLRCEDGVVAGLEQNRDIPTRLRDELNLVVPVIC